MTRPSYKLDNIQDPYLYRLSEEHIKIHRLANNNSQILEFEAIEFSKEFPHPPIEYRIIYKVKGMIGIDSGQNPKYANSHRMRISMPRNFPEQPAECKMESDSWHPNIKSDGPFKGAICTNHEGFGSLFFLDELIIRIGEFIQYKRYLAEDVPPWPEDTKVARWVREFAEPQKIVNREEGISVDDSIWDRSDTIKEDDPFDINIFERELEPQDTELSQIEKQDSEENDESDIFFTEL